MQSLQLHGGERYRQRTTSEMEGLHQLLDQQSTHAKGKIGNICQILMRHSKDLASLMYN